jgi:hypothetical protein
MPQKRHVIYTALSALCLAACNGNSSAITVIDEKPTTLMARPPATARYVKPVVDPATRASVDTLARHLAMQLASVGARKRLVSSLKASTADDEHKLALGQLRAGLREGAGAALGVRVSPVVSGMTEAFANLDSDLEVYLPVRSQRESYTGDDELLVAWALQEDEAPIAYTAAGERRVLPVDQPPAQPVLVIVPREEAEMDQVALDADCANRSNRAGAVGTWSCNPRAIRARQRRAGPVAASVLTQGATAKRPFAAPPSALIVPPRRRPSIARGDDASRIVHRRVVPVGLERAVDAWRP